jgi:2-hydroxy-3-keto-5-methylthiopentenyl-1-phosphate phosphatase
VASYKSRGRQVFYAGDGVTDLCHARKADLVFARSRLLEECRAEGLPHVELRDFSDVITEMERRSMSLEAAR